LLTLFHFYGYSQIYTYYRIFGWSLLSFIIAFLIDNILIVGFEFPGPFSIINNFSLLSFVEIAIYMIIFLFTVMVVLKNKSISLRKEAELLHVINVYLIRSCFWVIFLVGLVDITIPFFRVEKIFEVFFTKEFSSNFTRPIFVGTFIHIPLILVGFILGKFTKTLGFHWLSLLIVISELLIVIARFIFSYEQTFMGDLVRYWYAGLFLFASAYTLYEEGHVRVDIFYQGLQNKTKGLVNSVGSIVLGVSTSMTIIFIGFNGKQSIINSPILNFEITQQGSVGMFIKYHLAMFLGVFGITMLIQFISYFFESLADYNGEEGKRVIENQSSH
jgi:TRAP-type mannitol/chloroaromatic compound transport system permease small subunit